MRSTTLLRFFVLCAGGVAIGAAVASSCSVEYPTVAFRCNPRQSDNCPEEFKCCSDDPTASGGTRPQYMNRDPVTDPGVPIFSDNNNVLGTRGMCVRTADIPAGFTLLSPNAAGCPIPCNPSWTDDAIAQVCGGSVFKCCQTAELEPKDCVNDDGVWRPVNGGDIGDLTQWAINSHETHQDWAQGGVAPGCSQFSAGDEAIYEECLGRLTVADQRGFCMSVAGCPIAGMEYLDACEQINAGLIPPPF